MKYNTKLAQSDKKGFFKLRIWYRKRKGKKAGRYLIKCGCCDYSKIEIYPASYKDDGIEIGGVMASKAEWRKILLPLLKE